MNVARAPQPMQRWLIDEIARDLDLLDEWALPAQGGRDDFSEFLEVVGTLDPNEAGLPSKILIWLRFRMGELLNLDDPETNHVIPGSTETTLRSRVPEALRGSADDTPLGEVFRMAGLVPLYRTDDEWAGEISNATVHGVLHLAWVDQGDGLYRGRLAIYVKTRGLLGTAYMALIQPFRHLIIYPAFLRQIDRAWTQRAT